MNVLTLNKVCKVYDTGVEALKGVDLNVAEGDFFALLGPNGAGKSTTIGIITSLVRKTSGKVHIFGMDTDTHLGQAKLHIGTVPQEINFSQFETCQQIVAHQGGFFGLRRRQAQANAEKCLEQVGLWPKRNTPSRMLSGGMRRRLMLARAMVHEPRLLILDEPTAGVDVELRRGLWELLTQLNTGGTTIVLTTHYLEEAESLCRNIAIIDEGRIVENTRMRELIAALDVQTFVLDTCQAVSTPPDLRGCSVHRIDEHTLQVEISRQVTLNDMFNELSRHGIQVSGMRNKSNRLEELFMKLVDSKQQH